MNLHDELKNKKEEMREEAIRNGGFYGKNGVWNSIITFSNDKKLYRERVETIIVRNRKEVFLKRKPNGEYFLPGGSTEKDTPDIIQAMNECREEAHINVKNTMSTGITYKTKHEPPTWAKNECVVEWQGSFTNVYVAEFDSMYHGEIDKRDRDPFILSGKWYSTKECFKFFRKEHREALLWYLKMTDTRNEEVVTESYFTNFFKNLVLIKKINNNPDIARQAIEQLIEILTKNYKKLMKTAVVKQRIKDGTAREYFYPCCSYQFRDGDQITAALCFDKNEFSEGAAFKTEKHGSVIVFYPCFFECDLENQIFIVLHEIGHVRLHHVDPENYRYNIFGEPDGTNYRLRKMRKGQAMYTEINADLYAVLHGASMYQIIATAPTVDYDDKYDYRFTTAELASRYSHVFKKYLKLKKYKPRRRNKVRTESDNAYDFVSQIIQEMVYENSNTENLSSSDKEELFDILYEYTINEKIKSNEEIQKLSKIYDSYLESLNEKVDNYENIFFETMENVDNKSDILLNFENSDVSPIVVNESIYNLKKAYNDIHEKNIEIFENVCGENIEFESDVINDILNLSNDMTNKLKLKKESLEDTDRIDHFIYLLGALSNSDLNERK